MARFSRPVARGGSGGSVEPPFQQGAGSELLIKIKPHPTYSTCGNTVLTLFAELSGCSARLTTAGIITELEKVYSSCRALSLLSALTG